MDDESVRDRLRNISDVMDNFSLETMKIANFQADLCDVKKENMTLKEKVSSLEQETTILKEENTIHKGELGTLKYENTILKGELSSLKSDVHMLKSSFVSIVGQCNNEGQSELDGDIKELVDVDANLAGTNTNDPDGVQKKLKLTGGKPLNLGRKPKTQRKREQNEIFRNWRKTMTQRKTSEVLWASGLLKITIELWEDEDISMDGEKFLDFIQRNVEQLTTFISSEESKERFFLTIIKMCSIRKISKQQFQEIMFCFVNQGPRRVRITEPEVMKFIEIYKE